MHTIRHHIGATGVAVVFLLAASGGACAADTPIEPGSELTLQRAVELALQYHPARLAAQSEVGAARERTGQAHSALLPQVLGAAEYLRSTDNGIGDTTYLSPLGFPRYPSKGRNTNSADTFDNYLMGVSAYQYLFDFGRTRGLIDQRKAEADIERARLQFVDLDLVFRVTQRYYTLRRGQAEGEGLRQGRGATGRASARGGSQSAGRVEARDRHVHRQGGVGARQAAPRRRAERGREGQGRTRQRHGPGPERPRVSPGGRAHLRGDYRAARPIFEDSVQPTPGSEDAGRRSARGGGAHRGVQERLPAHHRRHRRLQCAWPGLPRREQLRRRRSGDAGRSSTVFSPITRSPKPNSIRTRSATPFRTCGNGSSCR